MKYKIILTSREWELIAEDFDFEKFNHGIYDQENRLGMYREAWQRDIPLYLHDVGIFEPEYLITAASKAKVNTDPVFDIFNKKLLTFAEMIQEIWDRRKKITKTVPGDDNPYE